MKMTRYFFISNNLDDLEGYEQDLERAHIETPHIHVLTTDDSGAANHNHINQVTSFMKRDIVHSTLLGAAIGLVLASLVLVVTHLSGWAQTPAGWLPFLFCAAAILGFSAWQGGLWGIQTPNVHFKHFEMALKQGKHVFFVDVNPTQERVVKQLAKKHHTLEPAGVARGAPQWIMLAQHYVTLLFTKVMPYRRAR